MLGWIKSLWTRKASRTRDIFEYEGDDGKQFGDPLRILRLLTTACGGDLASVVNGAQSPAPNIAAKHQATLDFAIRAAFGLKPYDEVTGQGKTCGEAADLLANFFDWRDRLKDGVARAVADVEAWFGAKERTYEEFVALWLNTPRAMYQRAAMCLAGSQGSRNNEQLHSVFADAIARFPEEIEDVLFEINSARAVAKSMSRRA